MEIFLLIQKILKIHPKRMATFKKMLQNPKTHVNKCVMCNNKSIYLIDNATTSMKCPDLSYKLQIVTFCPNF